MARFGSGMSKPERRRRILVQHGFGVNTILMGDELAGIWRSGRRHADTRPRPLTRYWPTLPWTDAPSCRWRWRPSGAEIAVGDGQGYVMTVATDGWTITGDYRVGRERPCLGAGLYRRWRFASGRRYRRRGLYLARPQQAGRADHGHHQARLPARSLGHVEWRAAVSPQMLGLSQPWTMTENVAPDRLFRGSSDGLLAVFRGISIRTRFANLGIDWTAETIDQLFDIGPDHYHPRVKNADAADYTTRGPAGSDRVSKGQYLRGET